MASGWRGEARRVINDVILDTPADAPFEAVLKRIDAAYPFGERAHWPYKAWLAERRAAVARLQGQAPLTYDSAEQAQPPPYVPLPTVEDWLRTHGRRKTA